MGACRDVNLLCAHVAHLFAVPLDMLHLQQRKVDDLRHLSPFATKWTRPAVVRHLLQKGYAVVPSGGRAGVVGWGTSLLYVLLGGGSWRAVWRLEQQERARTVATRAWPQSRKAAHRPATYIDIGYVAKPICHSFLHIINEAQADGTFQSEVGH